MDQDPPITPEDENPLAWVERLTIVGPFVAVEASSNWEEFAEATSSPDGVRVVAITTRRPDKAPRLIVGQRILVDGDEVWRANGIALLRLNSVIGHVIPAQVEPQELIESASQAQKRAHAALDRELEAQGEQQEPVQSSDEIL